MVRFFTRRIVRSLVSAATVVGAVLVIPAAASAEHSQSIASNRSFSQRIALGDAFTCVVVDGKVWCWGDNQEGAIGLSLATASSSTPVPVGSISNATAVAAGSTFACALLSDQTVTCWGRANKGQTGHESTLSSPTPVVVAGLGGVTAISAAGATACALIAGGTVKCWGDNDKGSLGRGSDSPSTDYNPALVTGLTDATAITSGAEVMGGTRTCAIKSDTSVVCWGPSTYGDIGNGVSSNDPSFPLSGGYNTPVTVLNDNGSTLQSVTAIDAGMDQTCVVLANTTAKCWGENIMGQIGNTDTSTRKLKAYPVMSEDGFSALSGITAISAGQYVSCVTMSTGAGKCFGDNMNGLMGNRLTGSSGTLGVPIDVVNVTNFVVVIAGYMHSCGMTTVGGVYCWGTVANGRLGGTAHAGAMFSDPTPVEVTGAAPQSISFGSLADKSMSDGTVTISATSSSGGAVAFASATPSTCTVSGSTVTLVGTGTCTVTASRGIYAMWAAASSVDRSFTISSVLPSATTGAATGISAGKAVLNGVVDPKGASTTVKFVYGTSSSLSVDTKEAAASTQTGTGNKDVSVSLTDLKDATVYYFRIVATNSAGTTQGSISSFTSGRPVGVSINDGAEFTNSRKVTVSVTAIAGSTQAIISNDGGFKSSTTVTLTDSVADVSWTLVASKDERLPKVVYVKFVTRFGNQSLAQSDDIILDTTAPTTASATGSTSNVPESSVSVKSVGASAVKNGVSLRVSASDSNSGIGTFEVKKSSGGSVTSVKATSPKAKSHTVRVKTTVKKLWVRSVDRAGNKSKWVIVTVK